MAKAVKILMVLGTRPEFVKLAPVATALKARGARVTICLTGQHVQLARPFERAFPVRASYELGVMRRGQSLATLTSRLLRRVEHVLSAERPAVVVVQGDTTSAMAAALAAFYQGIPIAHVEAGLRSLDLQQPFPEELNRRIVSTVAAVHYAPTSAAAKNLLAANIAARDIVVTGNTVIDAVLAVSQTLSGAASQSPGRLIVVTAHRRENVGEPLRRVCRAVTRIVREHADVSVVWPLHANPEVQRIVRAQLRNVPRVSLVNAMPYDEFITLLTRSYMVLTDSGGVQEEITAIGKPVLILREVTERPEVLRAGNGVIVGTIVADIVHAADDLLNKRDEYAKRSRVTKTFGDGKAAERIARHLLARFK